MCTHKHTACTHAHAHRQHAHAPLCNEIHPFKMHSLPDRDNVDPGLGRGKSCHTSLVGLGYRKDPLLRPFITKHCMLPVGLWSRAGAGGWGVGLGYGGKNGTQRQVTEFDRSSSALPLSAPNHPSASLHQGPRPIWWASCLLINRVKELGLFHPDLNRTRQCYSLVLKDIMRMNASFTCAYNHFRPHA